MKKLLLVREIYFAAFKDLGNAMIEKSFKVFSWFAIAMFAVVLYAFVFRVATGFAFQ